MALDAATLALTAAELKTTLADAKIAKLFEPTRDELVITLRTRTETDSLLLSARSGSARVCLTEESFENPETPPSFCMLMRKHLTGGRLLDVRMEPGDRIVYFEFQCTNEMGDLVRNILCAELMGRYSNLVLVQNGKIIDALKRVDFEDSDVRQLLPGLPYTTPPKPARPDFLTVSSASIVAAACQRDLPVADALNKTVAGVGPVVCREAAWRAFDGEHLLANELTEAQKVRLMAAIDELKEIYDAGGCPCSVTAPDGKPVEYTFFRPRQYGEKYLIKEWPSFNAMLEGYYAEKDRAERLRTKSKELHKAVHNMYERAVRKQAARQEELAASGKSEKLRLYGELLSANLYLAEKGMKSITVPNWYDEGKEVTIPLDLRFSPSQNAQNFFKNYKKKQTAARMLVDLLAEGEKEIDLSGNGALRGGDGFRRGGAERDPRRAQEPGLSEILQTARQAPEARRLPPLHVQRRLRDPGRPQQRPERQAHPPHRPGQGPVVPCSEGPRQPRGGHEPGRGHPRHHPAGGRRAGCRVFQHLQGRCRRQGGRGHHRGEKYLESQRGKARHGALRGVHHRLRHPPGGAGEGTENKMIQGGLPRKAAASERMRRPLFLCPGAEPGGEEDGLSHFVAYCCKIEDFE